MTPEARTLPAPTPADARLLRGLEWMFAIRLAVAVLGMVTVLVREEGPVEFPGPYLTAYSALALLCVANLVYLVAVRFAREYRFQAVVQLTVDVFLVALMAYATGGVQSVFSYLYFGIVFADAILLSARVALVHASLATVLLSGITVFYFLADYYRFDLPLLKRGTMHLVASDLGFVLPYLVFFSLSLHTIAILAGRLAAELQKVRILGEEILESLSGGVIAASPDGQIAFLNDNARDLLDIPAVGRPGTDALQVLRERPELGPLAQLLSDPREVHLELVLPPRDGKFRAVEVASTLLRGQGALLRGVILFVTDVGDRRLVEDAERKSARLEASTEMAAAIAHEIRNPLASVRGAIQELSEGLDLREDDRKLMDIILRESDRLDGIITRFLDYSRTRQTEFVEVDLAPILREALVLMERRDQDKRLVYEPYLPEHLRVTGDPDLLKQVFLNLLINAAEASPPQGRVIVRGREASIRQSSSAGRFERFEMLRKVEGVQVEISDQGPGIPPPVLPNIFDPFFTTKPRGTGMGLAVASKIVLTHHGQINAESLPASGARFTVWLPTRPVV